MNTGLQVWHNSSPNCILHIGMAKSVFHKSLEFMQDITIAILQSCKRLQYVIGNVYDATVGLVHQHCSLGTLRGVQILSFESVQQERREVKVCVMSCEGAAGACPPPLLISNEVLLPTHTVTCHIYKYNVLLSMESSVYSRHRGRNTRACIYVAESISQ